MRGLHVTVSLCLLQAENASCRIREMDSQEKKKKAIVADWRPAHRKVRTCWKFAASDMQSAASLHGAALVVMLSYLHY